MTSTLRILLVAAVTLSTILVGMRDTLAAIRTAEDRTCSIEGESFYGSREDDSGVKSEQVEEDDGDEDEGRDSHFLGVGACDFRPDQVARALSPPPLCRAAKLLRQDALVRGLPSRA